MAWTNLTFAYGAVLTSAQMTQLYNNITTGFPLFAAGSAGNYGTLLRFTKITASDATWAPHASTKTIVALVVGGGSGACGSRTTAGYENGVPGFAGASNMGATSVDVSGTYAATIGAGSAGVALADSAAGGSSSFIGTGISVTADGGLPAKLGSNGNAATSGETGINGVGGVRNVDTHGGAAAANSGAGGGAPVSSGVDNLYGGNGGSGVIYVWEFA